MYPNLQSKPGANHLLYINFDGYDSNDNSLDPEDKKWLLESL
jgi:hypothetical protein